jgi:hypothetical protein
MKFFSGENQTSLGKFPGTPACPATAAFFRPTYSNNDATWRNTAIALARPENCPEYGNWVIWTKV